MNLALEKILWPFKIIDSIEKLEVIKIGTKFLDICSILQSSQGCASFHTTGKFPTENTGSWFYH